MYQYRSRITLASTARYMVVTALAVTALLALLACTAGPGPLPAGGPTRAQAQQATATPPPAREPGATPTPSQEAAAGPERPAVAQAGGSVAPPEQPSPTASPQPQGRVSNCVGQRADLRSPAHRDACGRAGAAAHAVALPCADA